LLVEMAGVEPASENPSTRLSTSVVCLLRFPSGDADGQASPYGILLFMARDEESPCSRSLLIDASFRAAVFPEETGCN